MIFGLFGKKRVNRAIVDRQYAALTAAARRPAFYADLSVPDTVMGRFEMLSVVMILYFRRTGRSSAGIRALAQEIVDAFFQDIDHSIRELGVGDQGVPKRMKALASMFYGRLESYNAAIGAADAGLLAAALRRNIYPQQPQAPDMSGLSAYIMAADRDLKDVSEEELSEGRLDLPNPVRPAAE